MIIRTNSVYFKVNEGQRKIYKQAEASSKRFFAKPHNEKAACVDSQSCKWPAFSAAQPCLVLSRKPPPTSLPSKSRSGG